MTISLSGLDKAAVLAALYNGSQPQGMGFLHYDPTPMTVDQAKELLTQSERPYFDYIMGRVMKIDLNGGELDPWGYDRDNGEGSAQKVIQTLRETGDVNHETIRCDHAAKAMVQAMNTRGGLGDESESDGNGNFRLGLADMADYLEPKVDRVLRQG